MNKLLKSAQQKLTLKVITLRDSEIYFNEEYDCNFRESVKHHFQSFGGVKACNEIEFSPVEEDNDGFYQYKFLFANGIRVVLDTEQEADIEDEPEIIAEIKAFFEAAYESQEKLSIEEVHAFSESNVQFNVWPLWREYVQSSCMRMNITPISLPFHMVDSKESKETKGNE